MEEIVNYFPNLSPQQIEQLKQLDPLYREWNAKINVISRKDIDNLYERHVLHSMVIKKFINFLPGTQVLDLGTGGGFPGIPLAILFPKVHFTLIDGTRKKITVVQEVSKSVGLQNITARQIRAEEIKQRFDFVVTRAVATLDKLMGWSNRLIKTKENNAIPNGLIALKGGNIQSEIKLLPRGSYAEYYPLSDFYQEAFFEEKHLVYVQG